MDNLQKQRATEYAMYQALETLFPPGKCRIYNKNLLCRLFLAWQEQSENSKTQMLENCDKAAEEIEKKLPKSFFKGPATVIITPDAGSGGLSNHLDIYVEKYMCSIEVLGDKNNGVKYSDVFTENAK